MAIYRGSWARCMYVRSTDAALLPGSSTLGSARSRRQFPTSPQRATATLTSWNLQARYKWPDPSHLFALPLRVALGHVVSSFPDSRPSWHNFPAGVEAGRDGPGPLVLLNFKSHVKHEGDLDVTSSPALGVWRDGRRAACWLWRSPSQRWCVYVLAALWCA